MRIEIKQNDREVSRLLPSLKHEVIDGIIAEYMILQLQGMGEGNAPYVNDEIRKIVANKI